MTKIAIKFYSNTQAYTPKKQHKKGRSNLESIKNECQGIMYKNWNLLQYE